MNKNDTLKLQADDFEMALQEMQTMIDVSVDDLIQLHQSAEKYARLRRMESLLVENVMAQPVITLHPECSLSEAAHILATNKISGLPVVNEHSKLIGIITETDFLRALGIPSHHSNHSIWQTLENLFNHQLQVQEPEGIVSDLMMTDVITVLPKQTIHQALDLMKQNNIKRLIVRDEDYKVVGIVTRSDFVRLFFDHFKAQKK